MRKITRSVKVALKFLIAVVLVDVDLPYCTSKVEHIVAFTTIFSNICTAHAQKRLFMNFRCKFRHRRSIRRPRFPVGVQNFGDLETFYVDFCILYSECPPYFYFRFVRPTDLESIPHASTPTSIIPTKFEVDMCIHCRVIAFLSADTSRDCHGVSWGGFVNIAISAVVYIVLLFWRPPVVCYGEAAIVKTARHVLACTLT